MSFSSIAIFMMWIVVSTSPVAPQRSDCNTRTTCAIFDIRYPFWGGQRPKICGHPELRLECDDMLPEITIASQKYTILTIDYEDTSLIVTGNATHCPITNTTISSSVLSYSPAANQNLTLYYSYSKATSAASMVGSHPSNCSSPDDGTTVSGYFTTSEESSAPQVDDYLRPRCGCAVNVPALIPVGSPSTSLHQLLATGFQLQWNVDDEAVSEACNMCEASGGECGHASGHFACFKGGTNIYGSPLSPVAEESSKSGQTNIHGIIIRNIIMGGAIISVFIVIIGVGNLGMTWYRKWLQDRQNVKAFLQNHGSLAPKSYHYSQVKKIACSFSEKLGEGGYGDVYKGKLSNGRIVAVKLLKKSKGTGEDFLNEVASISRTSHVNIVTLLGFCYEGDKRALIYEYMANGSLDKFIYHERPPREMDYTLEWDMWKIAIGIARGLEYLHRGCNTRILHFDIKPNNILLDEEFCPKISDFGLAKLCEGKESIVSMLGTRGTMGYIAPEVYCRNLGGVSHKSDVYSYGMLVLEMVGERKNVDTGVSRTKEIYFPSWISKHADIGDEIELLGIKTEDEEKRARKMISVSLLCTQAAPSERPSMTKVVEMLEGSPEALQIPPKPSLTSSASSNNKFLLAFPSQTSLFSNSMKMRNRFMC